MSRSSSLEICSKNASVKKALQRVFAAYILSVLPLAVMTLSSLIFKNDWTQIVISSDWSLTACLMFGQQAAKVIVSLSRLRSINDASVELYVAKRVSLVVFSVLMYSFLQVKPSLTLGFFQIAWFVFASWFFFKDGIASLLIEDSKTVEPK